MNTANKRLEQDFEVCAKHKVPLIITSLQAPTDIARLTETPVLHVNGDDPEADADRGRAVHQPSRGVPTEESSGTGTAGARRGAAVDTVPQRRPIGTEREALRALWAEVDALLAISGNQVTPPLGSRK